jgi:hypothetical protein
MKSSSITRSLLSVACLGLLLGAAYASRAFAAPQQSTGPMLNPYATSKPIYAEEDGAHALRFEVLEEPRGSKLTCMLTPFVPASGTVSNPLGVKRASVTIKILGVYQRYDMWKVGSAWVTQIPSSVIFAVTSKDVTLEAICKDRNGFDVTWTAGASLSF